MRAGGGGVVGEALDDAGQLGEHVVAHPAGGGSEGVGVVSVARAVEATVGEPVDGVGERARGGGRRRRLGRAVAQASCRAG